LAQEATLAQVLRAVIVLAQFRTSLKQAMRSASRFLLLLVLAPTLGSATYSTTTPYQCWWIQYSAKEFEQVWYARLFIASIVATAVCALTTLLASLPVCCGAWRGKPLRRISGALGLIAGCSMSIPMVMGIVHRAYYTRELCDNGCDDTGCSEWYMQAHITFEDVVSDYNQGFGFLVLLFGVTTLVLSFLTCCRCCGPLREHDTQKQSVVSVVPDSV